MTRNLAYSTVSAGSAVLMLLLMMAVGRWLGVEDYGSFVWVIRLVTIAEVFMDFGLHQVTIRAIARDSQRAGNLFRTSLVLKLLPGVGMVLLFMAITFWLRPEPAVRMAALLMLLSAVMRSYLLTARGVLQGLARFGHDALVTCLDRAVLLVCCVAALWAGANLVQLSLVFLGARVMTTGVAFEVVRKLVGLGVFERTMWRRLVAEALPIGLFLAVLTLYNSVAVLMLEPMAGDYATGLYGAALPLYEGLTYATAILSTVLVPRLSRLWTTDVRAYRQLVTRSLIGTAVLAVVIAAVGWPLAEMAMRLVWPEEFVPGTTALKWLLVGLPFIYVIWVLHSVAISANKASVLVWVTAAGTLLSAGLNLFLIPAYSYNGAAIATVISEAFTMVLLFVGLRSTLRGGRASSVAETRLPE